MRAGRFDPREECKGWAIFRLASFAVCRYAVNMSKGKSAGYAATCSGQLAHRNQARFENRWHDPRDEIIKTLGW